MIKDLITLARIDVLRKELLERSLVDEEGKPYLSIPKLPLTYYSKDGKVYTYSVIRCTSDMDVELIQSLSINQSLLVVGEVINNTYVWKDEESQDMYEELREVGKYRRYEPMKDDTGQYVLDERMEVVKAKTPHPYMQGLFA